MERTILRFKRLEIKDFNARELKANINIFYDKNGREELMTKEFVLDEPMDIATSILLLIKMKGKMVVHEESDDDILGGVQITRIADEEEMEEKLFRFFSGLCEKVRSMKSTKIATNYMKLYNEIKIMKLVL